MWKSPLRWLRIAGYALAVCVMLVVALAAWLVYDLDSHLHSADRESASVGIESFREASPELQTEKDPARTGGHLDLRHLAQPPDTARPWTRWWWPGGDVTEQAACAQLSDLSAVGFGGVEIQAFNAGLQEIEDAATRRRINSFGDENFRSTLAGVMRCAGDLGVEVYLNHLSGWPAGGPEVALEDGLWTLRSAEARVTGGGPLRLELPVPTPGVNDYLMALAEHFIDMELSDFAVEERELVAVLAARVTGGKRSANPLDATDTLELDPDSLQVLTDSVVEGELRWQPPAGDWVIIASYLMPSGEAPTLVAAERPGYVIDHLDADRMRAHYDFAYGDRSGLAPYYGGAFQGFFNDSLEFKLDRLAARDIMQAFADRRGYDLTPHLPAVYVDAKDNFFIRDVGGAHAAPSFQLDQTDERVRYDYQLTLSDLIIERFVETSADWAQAHRLLSRGQTYGFELDTIRALGANHIPETEHLWGNSSEYTMKLAGAAGLLYRRPLVSAESFVWAKRAYAVTPRHIKAGADLLFLAGVNQVIYHGITYTTDAQAYADTFGWLGWYPFMGPGNPSGFADNYGPGSPTWAALPELNSYMARSQNILQSGEPSVDVLVYYPYLGFPKSVEYSELAGDALLFAGLLPGDPPLVGDGDIEIPLASFLPAAKDPRLAWLERLIPTLRMLDARGITWSWVNGHALASGMVDPGDVRALLLADVESIPLSAVAALESLSGSALDIHFLGKLPARQPGLLDHVRADEAVAQRVRALARGRTSRDAAQLAARIQPALALTGSPAIRRVSRTGEGGGMSHLLVNRSVEQASGTLLAEAGTAAPYAYWFDAASGAVWPAQPTAAGTFEVSLGALESRFLLFTEQAIATSAAPLSVTLRHAKTTLVLDGDWTMTAGSTRRAVAPPFDLVRQVPYADGARAELVYNSEFSMPEYPRPARVLLDLGAVSGIARLELNGEQFAPQSFDPFIFDVSAQIRPGANQVIVRVEPPLRNSLVASQGLMDAELEQFRDQLGEVGLRGPVTISTIADSATESLQPVNALPESRMTDGNAID